MIMTILINNDLDKHIQEKTSDKRVPRFGEILAPLSRETELMITIIIIIMLKRR